MIKIIHFFIVLSVLIFIGCNEESTSPKTTGNIEGKVLDGETYETIESVLITTVPPSESILTNADGSFIINDVVAGNYTINASKFGYNDNNVNIKVEPGNSTKVTVLLFDEAFDNTIPNTPELLAPINNYIDTTDVIDLLWTCSDDDNDKLTFDLYLDNVNPPALLLASGIDSSSYSVVDLQNNSDYYWQVIAKDVHNAISESEIRKFSVNIDTTRNHIGISTSNIIAFYPFTGNANDAGPNAYHGVPKGESNSAILTTDRNGVANSAYSFNGYNNYIEVPYSEAFDFKGDFSIAFWVKPNYFNSKSQDNHIYLMAKFDVPSTGRASYYFGLTTDQLIEVWTYNGAISFTESSSKVPDMIWNHITFVFEDYDGFNGNMDIYLNGNLSKSSPMRKPQQNQYNILIGTFQLFSSFFAGSMDEMYFYNRKLTKDEIDYLSSN